MTTTDTTTTAPDWRDLAAQLDQATIAFCEELEAEGKLQAATIWEIAHDDLLRREGNSRATAAFAHTPPPTGAEVGDHYEDEQGLPCRDLTLGSWSGNGWSIAAEVVEKLDGDQLHGYAGLRISTDDGATYGPNAAQALAAALVEASAVLERHVAAVAVAVVDLDELSGR